MWTSCVCLSRALHYLFDIYIHFSYINSAFLEADGEPLHNFSLSISFQVCVLPSKLIFPKGVQVESLAKKNSFSSDFEGIRTLILFKQWGERNPTDPSALCQIILCKVPFGFLQNLTIQKLDAVQGGFLWSMAFQTFRVLFLFLILKIRETATNKGMAGSRWWLKRVQCLLCLPHYQWDFLHPSSIPELLSNLWSQKIEVCFQLEA